MSLLNWMKRTTLTISVAAGIAAVPVEGAAFTAADDIDTYVPFGACSVRRIIEAETTVGWVQVTQPGSSGDGSVAGGAYYYVGEVRTFPVVTAAQIENCLGAPAGTVSVLAQNGADASFGADKYMGFSFTLGVAAGGLVAGPHEFAVSSDYIAPNNAPTANAGGAQSVASGTSPVTLDGTGSSANDAGQTLTYSWSQKSGPAAALSSNTASKPTFTAPTVAINATAMLTYELVVNDGHDDSTASSVVITVNGPANIVPVALAGKDASVVSGDEVTLNGSGEDTDGKIASYAWSRTGGTGDANNAVLSDVEAVSPTFTDSSLATGDDPVTHIFELKVTDDLKAESEAASVTITITPPADSVPPTIALSSDLSTVSVGQTATITFTLSEEATDFMAADVVTTGGTLSGFSGSGTSYSATFTPDAATFANGSVSVASGVFSDAAGNLNADGTEADNTVTIAVDTLAPSVVLSTSATALSAGSMFTVTAAFSEDVVGFTASDLVVTNGSPSLVSGGPGTYTVLVTSSGSGDVSVSVPANVAQDGSANGNAASNALSVADSTVEETQKVIANFMQSRTTLLLSQQPKLRRFLTGEAGTSSFVGRADADTGALSFNSVSANGNLWAELTASWATAGTAKSKYVFGAIGTHKSITPNLLLGAMLEFDYLDSQDGAASINGTGWLAGPYIVGKFTNQPVFYEGRLLYGRTNNKVTPLGTYTDKFETERWLAQFGISGEVLYDRFTLRPLADLSYTVDKQLAYTDGLGNLVSDQSIAQGQFELGLDFSAPLEVSRGTLELIGGVSGIWSHTSATGNAVAVVNPSDGLRGRIELGVNYEAANTGRIRLSSFYDGIGQSGYEAFGFTLGYERKF